MSVSDQLTPTPFNPVFDASTPRTVAIINGSPYLPTRWQVNLNGHGATDDATISLPIKGNPDFSVDFFSSGSGPIVPVPIEIWAGFPQNPQPGSLSRSGMSRRFLGNLDLYSAQPDGDDVAFTCRSLAAPLIDNKLTSAPMGMTAAQFAAAVAAPLGLTTNILLDGVAAANPITIQQMLGREFVGGSNYNGVVYNMHPWDVLLQCALFDDTDLWVSDNVLNYASPTLIPRTRIVVPYGSLMKDPKLSHSVQFNKNIRVEVRCWTQRTKTSYISRAEGDASSGITITQSTKTYTSSPIFGTPASITTSVTPTGQTSTTSVSAGGSYNTATSTESEPTRQIYKRFVENMTPAQCDKLAQSLWRQYSAQEYAIEFSLQMTAALLPQLSITALFAASGLPYANFNRAGTVNDGYYPRKLVETFDPHSGGWHVDVTAINLVLPSGAV